MKYYVDFVSKSCDLENLKKKELDFQGKNMVFFTKQKQNVDTCCAWYVNLITEYLRSDASVQYVFFLRKNGRRKKCQEINFRGSYLHLFQL